MPAAGCSSVLRLSTRSWIAAVRTRSPTRRPPFKTRIRSDNPNSSGNLGLPTGLGGCAVNTDDHDVTCVPNGLETLHPINRFDGIVCESSRFSTRSRFVVFGFALEESSN